MRLSILLACGLLLAATGAAAHGPQIQLTKTSGQLTTRRLIEDGPYSTALTPKTTVYVMPLADDIGVSYSRPNGSLTIDGFPEFYSGPGFAYGFGFEAGNPASAPFLVGSQFNLKFADGFKQWTGAAFADAGTAQLEAFRGGFETPSATARSSDTAPFAGMTLPTVAFSGDGAEVHSTVRYRYLGDGATPSSAATGIYLATFQLITNEANVTASDPFSFILHKGADPAQLQAAVASIGAAPGAVQFVPEPTTVSLAVAFAASLLAVRRRHAGAQV